MFLDDAPWAHFKNDVLLVMRAYEAEGAIPLKVSSRGLNVRTGPGVGHAIRYELMQGERVVAFRDKQVGDWVVVGEQEWVNSKYLTDINRTV